MRSVTAVAIFVMALLRVSLTLGAGADVRYEQGLVSASFDGVPVPDALVALQTATGLEIVLPPAALGKAVTLAVEEMPLEAFLRRLLAALDLDGYLLVYDSGRGTGRVLVVERGRGGETTSSETGRPEVRAPEAAASPGSPAPGPAYIPPLDPPVYIPPREPPVYIPPREPPAYNPPAVAPQ